VSVETKQQQKVAATTAPALEPPKIRLEYAGRVVEARLLLDSLGHGSLPILLSDLIVALNERYVREADAARHGDELPAVTEGRAWRLEQWLGQQNRACWRMKTLGALVSDSASEAEAAIGVPARLRGDAATAEK